MKVQICALQSDDFDKNLVDSLVNTGFAVITNHGIDFGLIKDVQSYWRQFFLSGQEIKNVFINEENSNMGYKGMRTEKAVGASKADLKEFFHWKPGNIMPYSVWDSTENLFYQLEEIGIYLLSVIDKENNTTYSEDCFESNHTLLRTLYYPAMDFKEEVGAVRAAAHEDINHITLLIAASAPGLEVKDNAGNWHAVPHEENSIVVNVGDMLQLASKGLYKSTTHRVVNPGDSTSDRISMPLFIHPHGKTVLSPGVTAKQFLDERISKIYGKV